MMTATPAATTIDRRRFLTGAAALTAAAVAWRPVTAGALSPVVPAALPADPFTLGVGSGDPLPDRVVLWTRLAPDPLNGGGMPGSDVAVDWEMATDTSFANVVASGTALAPAALAHSVHVDAGAGAEGPLTPGSEYFYRFTVDGYTSPVGRTRTAPANDATVSSLKFAFASCQSYSAGYYHAHGHLANESNLDLVLFLGDYIYEGAGTGVRTVPGTEARTLAGYRNRYALYRSDRDLQAAHQRCPWIVVWDDHEVDNDYADDTSQDNDPTDEFLVRRAEAYLAWWEHQAVRMAAPVGPNLEIYRSLQWGQLANFFALDGRQYRDDQATTCSTPGSLPVPVVERCDELVDPQRSMLGAAQEQWLDDGLAASDAIWNVVANQTVFAATPIRLSTLPELFNSDQWDGYPASRQRVLDMFARNDVRNPLVVTGDIHASGAGYLLRSFEPQAKASGRIVGHELVGTSISSTFPAAFAPVFNQFANSIEWLTYVNASLRGYVTVTLTPTQATARWRVVDTVATEARPPVRTDNTWVIAATEPGTPPSFVPAGFSDVGASSRFARDVDWLKGAGITTGVAGTNRFDPAGQVTRGQMAAFLWRMMGAPPESTPAGFTDVPANAFYAEAVRWLKANDITGGFGGPGLYSPGASVTRGQMVSFLWRLAGRPPESTPAGFTDVPASAAFAEAVRWAKVHGITTGTSPTSFSPQVPVTRGQMAQFLYRLASTPAAWNAPLPPTAVVD